MSSHAEHSVPQPNGDPNLTLTLPWCKVVRLTTKIYVVNEKYCATFIFALSLVSDAQF